MSNVFDNLRAWKEATENPAALPARIYYVLRTIFVRRLGPKKKKNAQGVSATH
jgi:hypothetical protein